MWRHSGPTIVNSAGIEIREIDFESEPRFKVGDQLHEPKRIDDPFRAHVEVVRDVLQGMPSERIGCSSTTPGGP